MINPFLPQRRFELHTKTLNSILDSTIADVHALCSNGESGLSPDLGCGAAFPCLMPRQRRVVVV